MKRSLAISTAVLCALYGAGAAQAQSISGRFEGLGVEIRLSSGGSSATLRELERAEHRLDLAKRAYEEARCALDELVARRGALLSELGAIEQRIAQCRPVDEYTLHRLREQLEAVRCEAAEIQSEISRFTNLASGARRAADHAKAEYFRQAECSDVVLDAKQRIQRAQHELEDVTQDALERLCSSYEWRRAQDWRDDVLRRLDEALRCRASHYEIERLRRELADAEDRMGVMKHEAVNRDPAVRDAEGRLAGAQRAHEQLWTEVERELSRDLAYCRAIADLENFEREKALAADALCRAQEELAGLEREIDRLAGAHFVADLRGLEQKAGSLRWSLDRLGGETRTAEDCLRRAQHELHEAQCAYDAARAAYQRCLEQERRYHQRPRYDPQRYDPPRRDYERDRGGDSGRYDRDDDRGYEGRGQRRDDGRERGRDDDRHPRQRNDARDDDRPGQPQDDERAQPPQRQRQQHADAQRNRGASSAGDASSHGTYRDRGERYQRAQDEEASRRGARE